MAKVPYAVSKSNAIKAELDEAFGNFRKRKPNLFVRIFRAVSKLWKF